MCGANFAFSRQGREILQKHTGVALKPLEESMVYTSYLITLIALWCIFSLTKYEKYTILLLSLSLMEVNAGNGE